MLHVQKRAQFLLSPRNPPIPETKNDGKYPDVLEGEWYTKYVVTGLALGFWDTDPQTGRAFPHKNITRGEFLRMLSYAYSLPLNLPHTFVDTPVNHPFYNVAGIAHQYKLFYDERDPFRLRTNLPVHHQELTRAFYTLARQNTAIQPRRNITGAKELNPQLTVLSIIMILKN